MLRKGPERAAKIRAKARGVNLVLRALACEQASTSAAVVMDGNTTAEPISVLEGGYAVC